MRWVRFVERRPPKDGPNEYVCACAGGDPFVYHVFIDRDNLTEMPNVYWLEGLTVPHVADPHKLRIPRHIPPVPPPDSLNQEPAKEGKRGNETQ